MKGGKNNVMFSQEGNKITIHISEIGEVSVQAVPGYPLHGRSRISPITVSSSSAVASPGALAFV